MSGLVAEIKNEAGRVQSEEMVLSMGPHHPSTHGVLRLEVITDGEVVTAARPDIGYLHRAIEKIGEYVDYRQFMPYTDRVDYLCSMNSNHAYALGVEKLANIKVPLRAELMRVMVAELNRISSHMICVGALAMDMGAFTPFLHGICHRELVNDIFEEVCGARLTYNYMTIGGVSYDASPGFIDKCDKFADYLWPKMVEFNELITGNSIFKDRLCNVGIVTPENAINWGLVGPNLRGSGVNWDLRRDEPYSIYGQFKWDGPGKLDPKIPVGDGGDPNGDNPEGTLGDSYDRYVVRVKEVFESIKIIKQIAAMMRENEKLPADHPDRQYQAKLPGKLKVKKGEVYVRSENPRGETGYYVVSDGTDKPMRLKIRTGSFTALNCFEEVTRGLLIGDVIAVIGAFDIVLPEVDR
ncbi:MAG TPA: NADH-quinone oxidoreductase subunit D [Planctomycetota bacterium]|nr:NADH-quinone oxidoreductase subunit D [Planctomycetota bacterium]